MTRRHCPPFLHLEFEMFSVRTNVDSDLEYINKLHVKQRILFASDIAKLAFPLLSGKYSDPKLPYRVVLMAEKYVFGQIDRSELREEASKTMSIVNDSNSRIVREILLLAIEVLMTALALPRKKSESVWGVMIMTGDALGHDNDNITWSKYNEFYNQAKPKKRPKLPITSELRAIAMDIVETRNFDEYNVLLDNLDENHGIVLPRELPLGLSHYVLFTLTNTN